MVGPGPEQGSRQLLGGWTRKAATERQRSEYSNMSVDSAYSHDGDANAAVAPSNASDTVRLPSAEQWNSATMASRPLAPSSFSGTNVAATSRRGQGHRHKDHNNISISSPFGLRGTSQDGVDGMGRSSSDTTRASPSPSISAPVPANYTYNTDWAPPRPAPVPPGLATGSGPGRVHNQVNHNSNGDSSHEVFSSGSTFLDSASSASGVMSTGVSSASPGAPPSLQPSRRRPGAPLHARSNSSDLSSTPSVPTASSAPPGESESAWYSQTSTPPLSSRPVNVPRYDKRGYPIKPTHSFASTCSSTPTATPNSPRSAGSAGATGPSSVASDDLSRYPLETDGVISGNAPSPIIIPAHNRTETIRHPQVGTVPEFTPTHSFYDDGSVDSHYSTYGVVMPPVYYGGGEPKPEESLCGSVVSTGEELEKGEKSEHIYTDFGLNHKGRRQLVSMLDNPLDWANLGPEDDDDFHNPEVHSKQTGLFASLLTFRGFTNMGCVIVLVVMLVALFAGYPIITAVLQDPLGTSGGFNLGGINASGQLPDVGPFQLIDRDTPQEAYFHTSYETGEQWELVFSDEFNRDGRTFYPGDDPYWQAEDYHYWSTNNFEWYDPRKLTTKNGSLHVELTWEPQKGLNYTGGLMTTWNRFCFTGGYIEVSVVLPGRNDVQGLWPAIWTLGNLGRAGYGGTLDGVWPYSYDYCDRGTLKNQTLNGEPKLPKKLGDKWKKGDFSYLPGQRFSRCTCDRSVSMHPGPRHADGTMVGRGAPEIDIFEALVDDAKEEGVMEGRVSMSAQWAPFNPGYQWVNTSETYHIDNKTLSYLNDYQGSVYQQATSVVVDTNQSCYDHNKACYSIYGFEYSQGYDGYITWVSDAKKAWTLRGSAMAANDLAMIEARPIPEEPMYIVINLGISSNFGGIDYEGLNKMWPVEMLVDYVRVYQDPSKKNIGCDPKDYPTADYIDKLSVAYNNPNITTYDQVMEYIPDVHWPKNELIDSCSPPKP